MKREERGKHYRMNWLLLRKRNLNWKVLQRDCLIMQTKGQRKQKKKSDAAKMKALVVESNTLREKAQKIQKKDIPAQVKEIHEIEQKITNV